MVAAESGGSRAPPGSAVPFGFGGDRGRTEFPFTAGWLVRLCDEGESETGCGSGRTATALALGACDGDGRGREGIGIWRGGVGKFKVGGAAEADGCGSPGWCVRSWWSRYRFCLGGAGVRRRGSVMIVS